MEPDTKPAWVADDGDRDVHFLRELKIRIVGSIVALSGGVVFILLYLGFLATRYPWYANLAVVLSTLIVVPAILIALWVHWGLSVGQRLARRFGGPGW